MREAGRDEGIGLPRGLQCSHSRDVSFDRAASRSLPCALPACSTEAYFTGSISLSSIVLVYLHDLLHLYVFNNSTCSFLSAFIFRLISSSAANLEGEVNGCDSANPYESEESQGHATGFAKHARQSKS